MYETGLAQCSLNSSSYLFIHPFIHPNPNKVSTMGLTVSYCVLRATEKMTGSDLMHGLHDLRMTKAQTR